MTWLLINIPRPLPPAFNEKQLLGDLVLWKFWHNFLNPRYPDPSSVTASPTAIPPRPLEPAGTCLCPAQGSPGLSSPLAPIFTKTRRFTCKTLKDFFRGQNIRQRCKAKPSLMSTSWWEEFCTLNYPRRHKWGAPGRQLLAEASACCISKVWSCDTKVRPKSQPCYLNKLNTPQFIPFWDAMLHQNVLLHLT